MVRKLRNIILALILINVVWAVSAIFVHRQILPNPWQVYSALPSMFVHEHFEINIYASIYRLFWGLLSATIVGELVGILIVRVPAFGKIANLLLYFIYPIPKIALLPILMLFLGIGEQSKIMLLFLANVFQVIVSVRDQVKQIPDEYYQMLDVLHANRWLKFRFVTWPASLSGLFSALRIELAASFALLFILEVYGTQIGLGYYIMDEWSRMEYIKMYAGIVVISALAFIIFIVIELLDNHFNRWRKFSM